jgi:hypothetical protein
MAVKLTGPVKLSEVNDYLGHPHGNPPNSISMNGGWLRSQTGNYPTNTSYRMSDMRGMMTQYGPFAARTTNILGNFYTKFHSGGSQSAPFSSVIWDESSQNNGADGYTSAAFLASPVDKGKNSFTAWVAVADVLEQSSGGYNTGTFSAQWRWLCSRTTTRYRHQEELVGMSLPNGGEVSYIHAKEFTLGESTQSTPTTHSWTSIKPYIQFSVYNYALEGSSVGQTQNIQAEYCNLKLLT